jgi:hypothetical protein
MGVGDHRAVDRADRVDEEIPGDAIKPLGAHAEPGFRVGHLPDVGADR